ncbi:hypothetical protein LAZ67_14001425, partial [Cordylochernes scorpioides]
MNIKKEATTQVGSFFVQHLPRNPSMFSGEGVEDPRSWLKGYERVAKHNQWDETLCLANVYFYLTGTALKWYENNEESIQTWTEFMSQLENVFGKNESSRLRAEKILKTRAQLKGESTEYYIQDVLRLCKEVDPQMNEEDKISHLMKGIAEELYQALIPRDVHNTEQFVTECRRIESIHCKRVTPTKYERLPNVASLSDHDDRADLSSMIRQIVREEVQRALGSTREEPKISTIEDMVKEEIGRTLAPISKHRRSSPQKEKPREFYNNRYVAQTIRPQQPKQVNGRRDTNEWRTTEGKPICFHCGRPGHKTQPVASPFPSGKLEDASYFGGKAAKFINPPLSTTLELKENYIDIKIEGKMTRALVDSGASYSVISERFRLKLRKIMFAETDVTLRVANGKIVRPKGRCTLKLDLNGLQESFEFVVMEDCSHEVILGWNFLKLSRAIIDSADDTLFLEKCLFEDTPKNSSPLYSELEYRIEPASIQLIEVASRDILNDAIVVAECRKELLLERELTAPSSVISLTNNRGKLWVVNWSPYPKLIPQGMHVADSAVIEDSQLCTLADCNQVETEAEHSEDPKISEFFIDDSLDESQKEKLKNLLKNYTDIFEFSKRKQFKDVNVKHRINTGDHLPTKQRPYRVAPRERQIIQDEVNKMEKLDIIQPSESPWASPVVLIRKKDGSWRFCVDYRRLNKITKKYVYPLPRIDDTLDCLRGARFYSSMDLQSGYWQIDVEESDREKTAFITPDGLYEFKVMPFGLCNAPATFERMIDNLLKGLKWTICLCYLDDIIVFSDGFEEHLRRLQLVLNCLKKAGLCLNSKKCKFGAKTITVLGHEVSENGIRPDQEKIRAVRDFATPRSLKEVRSFLGLSSYYRRFIPNYAHVAQPLNNLLKKDSAFNWNQEEQNAFEALKSALISEPALGHFDYSSPTEIHTDASNYGIGAVLVQIQKGKERAIAYASRTLNKAEKNYSTTERECLAIIWAINKFRPYVFGQPFTIVTDHHSLCWLTNLKDPCGRLARWALRLQEFDVTVVYKSGRKHQDADCLSRSPLEYSEDMEEDIPSIVTLQNFSEEQMNDQAIRKIADKLQSSPNNSFVKIDNTLYRKNYDPMGKPWLLVVPRHLRQELLKNFHDSPTAGHLGFTKTYDRIRKKYYWPGMYRTVRRYVAHCSDCQRRKHQPQLPSGHLQPIPVPEVAFEKVGMDLLGRFPTSEGGNRWIIVCTDYLTKYAITKALPTSESMEVAKFFIEDVILKHGAPRELITDRGRNFTSSMISDLNNQCRITHRKTTAYHPQTNGLTERLNKTIADMLSMYVDVNHKDWDRILPFVTFAYNTAKQESTGFTPFFLVHGREAETPLDVLFPKLLPEDDDFIQTLGARAEEARKLARIHSMRSQGSNKHRYDAHHRNIIYQPGDLVWIFIPVRKVGYSEKLMRRYFGPYKVTRKISDVTYEVETFGNQQGRRKTKDLVHIGRMKPYLNPEDQEDQLEEDPEDDSTDFQEEDIPTERTQQPQTREEISGPITRSRALRLRISFEDASRGVFGLQEDSARRAEEVLKSRAQKAEESSESYIQEILSLCHQVNPRKKEAAQDRPYEIRQVVNVMPISCVDDSDDLSGLIRRIVREEIQKVFSAPEVINPFREVNALEQTVREEVSRALQPTRPQVNVVQQQPRTPYYNIDRPTKPRKTEHWRTYDDKLICFHCGRPGHVVRYCRERRQVFAEARTRNGGEGRNVGFSSRPPRYDADNDYVTPQTSTHDIIFGWDFFKATEAVIDCGRNELHLGETSVLESREEENQRLFASDDFVISPKSIKISVINEKICGVRDVLVSTSKDLLLRKEVLIPNSLVTFRHGRGSIWVANGASWPQLIPSGMNMCTMESYENGKICSLIESSDKLQETQLKSREWSQKIILTLDPGLSEIQRLQLVSCLDEFIDIFDFRSTPIKPNSTVKHKINTGDHSPIKQRPYRVTPSERRLIQDEVNKMIENHIVKPSESPWSSPVILVRKKDGTWRFCVDYQPVLGHFDESADTHLHTDASEHGIGAVLLQIQGGKERPIAYASKSLTKAENNYSTTEKEFLAVVGSISKFRPYLFSRPFMVVTEHHSLCWLHNWKTLAYDDPVMADFHDAPTAGHLGFARTYDKVKKRFYWPGLYRTVRQYVSHCRDCHRRKKLPRRTTGQLVSIPPVEKPFYKVGVDLLGRFPVSKDGNRWITVCTDYITRYAITKAIPDGGAIETAKFLVEDVILKHGAPREIITDCGRNFISQVIKEINALCGIVHRFTTAYHPQTNGLTERFNKTLGDMLSMYTGVEQKDWDQVLPYVTFAYNTAKQKVTGYTPFFLFHAREVETYINAVLPYLPDEISDDYVGELVTKAEEARQLSRSRLLHSQAKDRRLYDQKHTPVYYQKDDLVSTPISTVSMPRRKIRAHYEHMSEFDTGRAIGLKEAGWSNRLIARHLCRSDAAIRRCWQKWVNNGSMQRQDGSGRPRATTELEDRAIVRMAVAAPESTLSTIQRVTGTQVSKMTVNRRLRARNLRDRRLLRCLLLTPVHRQVRLQWCRERSTWNCADWGRIVFCDESRFLLCPDDLRKRVWRRPGQRVDPGLTVEHHTGPQQGVMVWGAISFDRRTPLVVIPVTLTAQRYVDDILRPVLLPFLSHHPGLTLQQDNARPHRHVLLWIVFNLAELFRGQQVFDRLPNVAAIDSADSESMEDLIRRIVREEVHRALNPESTTPEPSSLKEIIREEIEKNVASISKPIQRPPPRQSYPNQTRTFSQVPRRQYPTQTLIYNQTPPQRRTDEWRTHDNIPICFNCGRPGHVKRYCRERRQWTQRPEGHAPSTQEPQMIISDGLRRQLKKTMFKDSGMTLKVADGKNVTSIGRCTISLSINGLELPLEFIVLPNSNPSIILGWDFLEASNAVIDCGRAEIRLEEAKDVLNSPASMGKVVASRSVVIPAEYTKLINVMSEEHNGQNQVLFEPSKKVLIGKELTLPCALFRVSHNKGKLWIVNSSTTAQIVPKGMCLGKIQRVEENNLTAISECSEFNKEVKNANRASHADKSDFKFLLNLISDDLSEEQQSQILSILKRHDKIFDKNNEPVKQTSVTKHKIETGNHQPIKHRPYRVSPTERQAIQTEVDKMLDAGIIRHSESPWSSPVILVKKKDGNWRFYVDYRRLNKVTKKDVYPLPRIDDTLDSLKGAKFYSSMDLRSGYWQIEVDEADREKTAFITPDGLYEFLVMPFGLCNAPATFERMMDKILKGLKWTMALCYLDDIVDAFDSLKKSLMSEPVLAYFEEQLLTELHTDASGYGIGAVLVQINDGKERPVGYASRTLSKAEKNYSTTERECLAAIWAINKFRPYLFGREFVIVTDHHALCWLSNLKDPTGRLARWALKLQEYNVTVVYKSGRKHQDADCLSRNPLQLESEEAYNDEDDDIPSITALTCFEAEQRKDPKICKLIEETEIFGAESKGYEMLKGTLYKNNFDPLGNQHLLVIPKHLRLELLKSLHDAPTAGHLGFSKTYERVKNKYFWPGLLWDIRKYVAHCKECQRKKQSTQKPPRLLKAIPPATSPFQRVGMDLLGRFPKSDTGNKWIIVCTDYLTRFAVTKALPTGEAKEAAKFLMEDVILKHGAPREIIMDRGRVFQSKLIAELTNQCSSIHRFTTAYHPQTNGLTERLNKPLANMIAMYVSVEQKDWDVILPYVTFAYNTAKQNTTGFTPFKLIHGREAETTVDTLFPNPHEDLQEDYSQKIASQVEETRQLARLETLKAQEKDKARYDSKHEAMDYNVGDLVWIFIPIRKVGLSEKLMKRYFGPYRVTRKLSDVTFEVEPVDQPTRRRKTRDLVHVLRMKPYHDPEDQADLF